MSQHRITKFPVILTKTTLKHNKVTLKIEPARLCEVFRVFRQVGLVESVSFPLIPVPSPSQPENSPNISGPVPFLFPAIFY